MKQKNGFPPFIFKSLLIAGIFLITTSFLTAQTTVFFQGFENASPTCAENWGYTGGVRNSETARTGTFSGRVGRLAESNTLLFNTVNIASLSGVNLQIYHSVRSGSGPGMDTREGADIQVSLNGGAFTNIAQVCGNSDLSWAWNALGGTTNTCPQTFTCPNPFNYTVPAGTNTIAIRVLSVNRNSSTCANFLTDMTNGTASNYDRNDEGFFIDDVKLTTTSAAIPGIWTGLVSSDWFDCNNWNNRIVPNALSNVTIDQTAARDCIVGVAATGNAACNNLALSSNSGTVRNLIVQNSASLTCSGNVTVTKTVSNSSDLKLTLLNSATFSCVNLTLTGTASGDEDAQFENELSTSVTATINGNFTNNPGGKFDLTNSPNYGIVHLHGDYNNLGLETDYKQTNSYIILDGTGNQNINTNNFTEIFSHLVVNKSSGTAMLLDNIEIELQLDMQNGPLDLNAKTAQIDNNATTGITRTNGYVISENVLNTSQILWQMGSTGGAHVFPFGTIAGDYIPFTFNRTAGTSNNVTLSTYGTAPDNLPWPTTPINVNNLQSSIGLLPDNRDATVDRFWQITVSGTPTATLTFSYAPSELPIFPYDVPSTMVAQRYNGATNQWQSPLSGQSAVAYAVTVPGVSTFSPWTLTNSISPLPVELLWFRGNKSADDVLLSWETASEVNNDYFTVERATDISSFTAIGTVNGNGTSSQTHSYSFTDENPVEGNNYYRLKQTDYNGQFRYSAVININFSNELKGQSVANAWICDEGICYAVSAWNEPVRIDIFDMTGRKIASRILENDETGNIPLSTDAAYIVRFESDHQQQIRKLVR